MTHNETLFKELDKSIVSSVKIGNGDQIAIKGKRIVAIPTCIGTKMIFDVYFVPEIGQNFVKCWVVT